MSFLGKVLVGLNFALSIVFLTFAGAVFSTQQNWMNEKIKVAKNLEDVTREKDQLAEEKRQAEVRLTNELTNEKMRASEAEGKAATSDKRLEVAEQELIAARTTSDEQRTLAKLTAEEARQRYDEALLQRAVNNNLHVLLNQKNEKNKALEDIVFNKTVEEKSMQDKHGKLLADYVILQKIIASAGLPTDPKLVAGLQTPPPAVEGKVLETKRSGRSGSDLVEFSLGSDDGLVEGHKLDVFRPALGDRAAKFLGEIKIVYVTPDKAVGAVVSRAKNGIIEKGDHVTSKL